LTVALEDRRISFVSGERRSAPNAFEIAILQAIARERPSLILDLDHLEVRSRRYTGVGSYTDFVCDESPDDDMLKLKAPIAVAGVPHGMGAVLMCRGHRPESLETFTYGDDGWTGALEGFSVG